MLIVDVEATGKNIRKLITERGLKTSWVKQQLGITSPATVYKWFKGVCLPDTERLFQLADCLNCGVEEIVITKRI